MLEVRLICALIGSTGGFGGGGEGGGDRGGGGEGDGGDGGGGGARGGHGGGGAVIQQMHQLWVLQSSDPKPAAVKIRDDARLGVVWIDSEQNGGVPVTGPDAMIGI